MAEYKDDDRVMVYNRNTGITQPVKWRAVKNASTRRTQGLEIVGEPAPKSTEVDREKVERLKAQFADDKPTAKPAEVEPEKVEPEATDKVETLSDVSAEVDYSEKTLKDLKELAIERGLDFAKNARKDKMIELLSK